MTAYMTRVLINEYYEGIKSKYVITGSTMTSHMINIYHPLQCRNMRQLKKILKTGEVLI